MSDNVKDTRSAREKEASEMEAKAKALRRAEKAFWEEVEQRLSEIKKRFNLSNTVKADFRKPEADHRPSFNG